MKKRCPLLLTMLLAAILHAAQPQSASTSDEQSKVIGLIDLAKAYKSSNTSQALSTINEAISLATSIGYKEGLAQSYLVQGQIFYNTAQYDNCRQSIEQAGQLFKQIDNTAMYALARKELGDYYRSIGQSDRARELIAEAIGIARDIKHQQLEAECEIAAGIVDMKTGQYISATQHYLLALDIGDKNKLENIMSMANIELGTLNSLQGNFEVSNGYYEKALAAHIKSGNKLGMADVDCNMGANYLVLGEYDKAESMITRSINLSRELNYKTTLATGLLNLGYVYSYTNKPALGLEKFQEAKKIYAEQNDLHGQIEVMNAEAYFSSKNKDYEKAASLYLASSDLAKKINANALLKTAYEGLAYIFEQKKEYETAYKFQSKANELNKQFFSVNNMKIATQMQLSYDFEKERKEAAQRQQLKDKLVIEEKKRDRITMIGLTLFVITLSIMVFFALKAYRFNKQAKLLLQEKNKLITEQKEKAERILSDIIPVEIESKLLESNLSQVEKFATVMFVDFHEFSKTEAKFHPADLMDELDIIFKGLDEISKKFCLETLRTLSDGYLCIGGLATGSDIRPENVVQAAIKVQQFMEELKLKNISEGKPYFEMSIGIHSGLITGGIVGIRTLSADVWGETVQTASHIEKMAGGGEITISDSTFELVKTKFESIYAGQARNGNEMIGVHQIIHFKTEMSNLSVTNNMQELLNKFTS